MSPFSGAPVTDTLPPRPRRPLRTAILLLAGTIVAGIVSVVVHEVFAVRRHMAAVERIEALEWGWRSVSSCGWRYSPEVLNDTADLDGHLDAASRLTDRSRRPFWQRIAAGISGEDDAQWPVAFVTPRSETGEPEWSLLQDLPEIRGLELDPYSLQLSDEGRIADEGLKTVSRMRGLQVLLLDGLSLTREDLDILVPPAASRTACASHGDALPMLLALSLGGTSIDDTCLPVVARLNSLHVLNLRRTRISDSGLEGLGGLPSLWSLDLSGTPVSDAGMATIAKMPRLEELNLNWTHITDAGLAVVGGMRSLKCLYLDGTRVSDAGLAALVDLPHLEWLFAAETDLSDAAVANLVRCRRLKHVDVVRTRITEAGAERVRSALPTCKVDHSVPE